MDWDYFDCQVVIYNNRRAILVEDSDKNIPVLESGTIITEVKALHYYPEGRGRVEAFTHDGGIWVIHDIDEVRGKNTK